MTLYWRQDAGPQRPALTSSLGLGFVKHYAALPDHTVISAVRKPESMPQVDCAEGTKIVTVKIDSADTADAKKASLLPERYISRPKADVVGCRGAQEQAQHQ